MAPTHKTILVGWDENRNVVYMRTFDYENNQSDKDAAQASIEWVSDKTNCKGGWMISDISGVNITESDF